MESTSDNGVVVGIIPICNPWHWCEMDLAAPQIHDSTIPATFANRACSCKALIQDWFTYGLEGLAAVVMAPSEKLACPGISGERL